MRSNVFLLLFCFFLTQPVFAATQVRGDSVTAPLVWASNSPLDSNFMSMVAEGPGAVSSAGSGSGSGSSTGSGSGETEALPFKAYIPLGSTAPAQEVCTIVAHGALLPEPPTVSPPSSDGFIRINLNLTNDSGSTQTLFAAVKDGSNYEIFTLSTTTSIASSPGTITPFGVIFNLGNMCANQSTTCSTISSAATNGQREGEFLVYFFLDSVTHAAGDTIATSTNGLFYSLKISDKMPSGNYVLLDLRKGDERLVAEVRDGDLITQMGTNLYGTMVFRYSGTPVDDECPGTAIAAARGALYAMEAPVLNGTIAIKNLTNETPYTFSVALVNKFQFTTGLNNAVTETPQSIEALLKANGCFLLTVGFEGDHPTITYFRHFRDQVLLGEFWGGHIGKALVAVYYSYGPHLARQIIEVNPRSPIDLKYWIRTAATALQSIMQLFWK